MIMKSPQNKQFRSSNLRNINNQQIEETLQSELQPNSWQGNW